MKTSPLNWIITGIEETLRPFENRQTLRQGWSPQCERFPVQSESDWGVLKTTAIQDGEFQPQHNKQLPPTLEPDPLLEVKEGDLLLTCAGPRVRCGVICLVRKTRNRLMISGKMYRFRTDERITLPTYLEAFLRFHDTKKRIDEMKTGISDSGLNLTLARFKTLQVPIPPLNEQHRIVEKIEELFSELDKGIENLKQARAQLAVYRQALLKHAFEGKLTADWRAVHADQLESAEQLLARIRVERENRYQKQLADWKKAVKTGDTGEDKNFKLSKPREPKGLRSLNENIREKLAILPSSWAWDVLGWTTSGVEYGSAAKSSKSGTHVVLRMGNLQNGKLDWSDLAFSSDPKEVAQYILHPGDVLFNRTNSPEWVGKTAIYRGERPALLAGYLIRINHSDQAVLSEYLNWFLNSPVAKQHGNTVKTDGVNQSNINGEKLMNYPFPYCSLVEQSEIVRILDETISLIDYSTEDIDTNLQKAEALRQSILKKAFAGELVPQDPNDEPAADLLARIRAERDVSSPRTSRRSPRSSKPSLANQLL